MPAVPPPPLPGSYPNCAMEYLYQLGDLHYYRTIDCQTGVLGYGVSGNNIGSDSSPCTGGTCKAGRTVTPVANLPFFPRSRTLMEIMRSTDVEKSRKEVIEFVFGLGSDSAKNLGHKFKRTKTCKCCAWEFLKRFCDRVNHSEKIDNRRYDIAEYLLKDKANPNNPSASHDQSVLDAILGLPVEIGDIFMSLIGRELETTRLDLAGSPHQFVSYGVDFGVETIGNGPFGNLHRLVNAQNGTEFTINNKHLFKAKIELPRGPTKHIYFRLAKFEGSLLHNGVAIPFTHYVGQQVAEADVQPAHVSNRGLDWIDRQSHLHVVRLTPDGTPENHGFFVYSADDLSTRELIS